VSTNAVSRRNALSGAATVGLGLPLLAACGGDDGGGRTATAPSDSPSSSAPSSEPPASPPTRSTKDPAPKPANGLVTTADVPVGSGVVLADSEVVITQPTKGDFKAFTAICTHQGCTVIDVTDTINCPCHFSEFSIEDGSNVAGPSGTAAGSVGPLSPIEIKVDGDQISLA
jgi:nitrite reductase/ring-hydroxylating ferredoxin subunit